MSTTPTSHAQENGAVPHAPAAVVTDRRRRLGLAVSAGLSAGLRTFTAPATALRSKDNAWAPLVASLARTELIYDKLPMTPTRLRFQGLLFRAVAAAGCGASLATRKDPAWLPLAAAAVTAAMASAYLGATLRIRAIERGVPDLLLAAFEDQLAIGFAERAFPMPEITREFVAPVKTVSLL